MDQQAKYTRKDILDLTAPAQNCNSIALHPSRIDKNKGILPPIMSNEELKIRGELEMDIESDLEQEIKDGIYHLALRLHRLYQHQKERNAREVSESVTKNHQEKRNKTLSEVNISIKLEGGTRIEIKETKKEAPEKGIRPRTARSDYNNLQGILVCDTKKFDWAKSLRSAGSGSTAINKRNIERPPQGRNLNYDIARRNLTSSSGQRKGNASVHNKVLELGWKC